MSLILFSLLVFGASIFAGVLGALTGLGGGVVIIPLLALFFKVDLHYAMGASLIAVIATSSGTLFAHLKEGYTNLRMGVFLEMGAVIGAVLGASLVPYIETSFLGVILGIVLFISAVLSFFQKGESLKQKYGVKRVPLGFSLLTLAGFFSGLLGIGSGALKVLAMDKAMGLPYKVATATSNFMIGITATVSAGIYLKKGYIVPQVTFPVMMGVLLGAYLGIKVLMRAKTSVLRYIFGCVVMAIAIELIYKGMSQGL